MERGEGNVIAAVDVNIWEVPSTTTRLTSRLLDKKTELYIQQEE